MTLPSGNYTKASLARWGIADDDISGLLPASGMEIEIFKNESFGGDSVLHRAANYYLSWADNSTSCLRIRSSSIVFRDNFNTGIQNWITSAGTWSAEDGTLVGTGNGEHGITFVHTNNSFNGSIVLDVDVDMVHAYAGLYSTQQEANERIQSRNLVEHEPRLPEQLSDNGCRNGQYFTLTNGAVPIPNKSHVTV